MKVLGVIPARWQSSRFPGKPLADILGKSLIRRTYENALDSKSLDALVIATDDERIYEHAQDFGAKVFMTPPSCPTGTDRVWEVVNNHFPEVDIVVNIQGDEPFLSPLVIDTLVNRLSYNPEALITTPVAGISNPELIYNKNVVKCVFDSHGKALYFSRSPIPCLYGKKTMYHRHLGVYCFRLDFLRTYVRLEKTPLQESEDLEQLKILEHGFPVHICIVEDQAIGVDTPDDLKTVEKILCQKESMYL